MNDVFGRVKSELVQRVSALNVKKLIRLMCYVVIFMAVLSFLSSTVFGAAPPVGVVTSNSMVPMMRLGDIVFIQPSSLANVHIGDIIAYQATPNSIITHRVVDEWVLPGRTYLFTKGDANDYVDQSVGLAPVTDTNFLGKIFCIDGVPVEIPLIGQLWMFIYNLSVTLTQNRPWSFWAPILAILYICWPSLSNTTKVYQKHFSRISINKKRVFIILFIAFTGISLFTMWLGNEQYTVGLRVACLLDFANKPDFNYGSMIPGEAHDSNITMTGAPMFPVKAVSTVYGNASLLSTVNPKSTIVEPNSYINLNLHTAVPATYGQVAPGLYQGTIYIFSSSLWIFIPDSVIFQIFTGFSNPWIAAITLELLGTIMLASFIILIFFVGEFLVKQTAYTYVWLKHLPESGAAPRYLLVIKSLKTKTHNGIDVIKTDLATKAGAIVSIFSAEGKVQNLRIFTAIAVVSYATYFLTRVFTMSMILECSLLCLYAIWMRLKQTQAFIGAMFTHLVYCGILLVYNAVSAVFGFYGLFSLPATGFTGVLFAVVTTPLIFTTFLMIFKVLVSLRILTLEQETMNWVIFRKVKFVWPNFETLTVAAVPQKIEIWRYTLSRRVLTLIEPRKLVAENCKVIEPLQYAQKIPGKLDVESYISAPKSFFEKIEGNLGIKLRRLLTTEEYWIGAARKSDRLNGGKV